MTNSDNPIRQIRVLVADDSAVARRVITRAFEAHSHIQVCGTACNGLEAVEKTRRLHPDVVALDVDMPVLDGIQALRRIMQVAPCPVVMVSSLTLEGAEITIEALTAGAFDYVPKESLQRAFQAIEFRHELIEKIEAAADSPLARHTIPPQPHKPRAAPHLVDFATEPEVVVIGASTGGPGALQQILPALPEDLPVPVVIVQHMPVGFTSPLAVRLNMLSPIAIREARQLDQLERATVYIAPAGQHATVLSRTHKKSILLANTPAGTLHKPSVDVTMTSVAQVFGRHAMGIILTGMGCDGLQGMTAIRDAGGITVGQDEASCAVYGMPRTCAQHHVLQAVVPLPDMAAQILLALRYQPKCPAANANVSFSLSKART
jgi:two-component system chemotaxis response regulator CheB